MYLLNDNVGFSAFRFVGDVDCTSTLAAYRLRSKRLCLDRCFIMASRTLVSRVVILRTIGLRVQEQAIPPGASVTQHDPTGNTDTISPFAACFKAGANGNVCVPASEYRIAGAVINEWSVVNFGTESDSLSQWNARSPVVPLPLNAVLHMSERAMRRSCLRVTPSQQPEVNGNVQGDAHIKALPYIPNRDSSPGNRRNSASHLRPQARRFESACRTRFPRRTPEPVQVATPLGRHSFCNETHWLAD
jgi:hypothetical protein